MESIAYNISQVLGITVLHSLWQGLSVWFVLRLIFAAFPQLSSARKYNAAILTVACMFICFVFTLCAEIEAYNWTSIQPAGKLFLLSYLKLPANTANSAAAPSIYKSIAAYLPCISAIYITGLGVNLLKLGWSWNKMRQIKQSVIPAGQMQQFINTLSKRLNINKHIQLKFSSLVDVPSVTGFVKPLILLPVSIATSLTACEIESILLHELAHIKRNDYLVNLVQQIVGVMLFFNPFAHLVNRIVNEERENACDELVVANCEKPLIYATALLKLEENRN